MAALRSWLFSPVAAGRVAVFRTLAYSFIFIDVLLTTSWVAQHGWVPTELYQPLFIARLLQLPTPTPVLVTVVEAGLLLSALLALHPRWTRPAGIAVFILYLEWMFIAMSYGKVDHDRVAFLVALAVLPTVRAARWGEQRASEDAGWAIRCIQIAVVLTYFLATFAKLRFGGLEWVNGATLMRAVLRRGTVLVDPLTVENPWILHAYQYFIVAFELASPLMLLQNAVGRFYVKLAFAFHALTYASITIIFLPHVVCLLTFLPLERVKAPSWVSRPIRRFQRA
ncbi:MAG: HTTM domain-containing protein [Actinomycetota bacterium]